MLFILETRKIKEPLKELLILFIKLKQKIKCCVKFKPKWAYFYKHITMSCKIVWCGIPCSLTYRWRIWKLGIIVFFIAMEILGGSMEWDDSIKIWEIIMEMKVRCKKVSYNEWNLSNPLKYGTWNKSCAQLKYCKKY